MTDSTQATKWKESKATSPFFPNKVITALNRIQSLRQQYGNEQDIDMEKAPQRAISHYVTQRNHRLRTVSKTTVEFKSILNQTLIVQCIVTKDNNKTTDRTKTWKSPSASD